VGELKMKKVKVDKEACIGCGLCASIADKAFVIDNEGKVKILKIEEEDKAKVQEAIESCPVGAIVWED
jgi:ferredoxin